MGFAQAGKAFTGGDNLAIAGVKPSGMAAKGQVFWVAGQAWTLISSTTIQSPGLIGNVNGTLNTVGANLIVVLCTHATGTLTVVDGNNSPGWAATPPLANFNYIQALYCINPITSSNHTVTYGAPYGSAVVLAFKGPSSIAYDQSVYSPTYTDNRAVSLGPLTPSKAGALVVSGIATASDDPTAISGGFTMGPGVTHITGQMSASHTAYLSQASPAALNPTWTVGPATVQSAAIMLSFVPQ